MLPFSNTLVVMDMTGAQLRRRSSSSGCASTPTARPRCCICRMASATPGTAPGRRPARGAGQLKLDGVAIDDAKTYRVAANNFLAEGGDGFTAFGEAANKRNTQILDLDAFVRYLSSTTGPASRRAARCRGPHRDARK